VEGVGAIVCREEGIRKLGVGRALEAALEVEVEVESGLAVGTDVQVCGW
jgi:hypothetical protein